MNKIINEYILTHESELINERRYLHQEAELSFEEIKTSNYIANILDQLEVPYRWMNPTGILAEIKGETIGKTVLLRADIDALPINEMNDHLDYRSKHLGKMHACGHDAHTAMLLTALRALLQVKKSIKGTIRFVFQPAEEIAAGAKKMIEQGVLEGVDNVFGIHIWSVNQTGLVACDPGPTFAGSDMFKIHFRGQGGHAAQPHLTHDAVIMATEYINNIQSIISRCVNPMETAVLTVGRFNSGDRFNIIAENAFLEGTVRTFSQEVRHIVETQMKHYAEQIAVMYHASVDFEYIHLTEAVVNHEASARLVQSVTKQTFGSEFIYHDVSTMAAEDFGFYLTEVPGAFATLGCRNTLKASDYPHHHGRFNVDEDALKMGAELYAQYALSYLEQNEF